MPTDQESRPLNHTTRLANARTWLAQQGDAILAEQIELARVPAPPFHERTRSMTIETKIRPLGIRPRFDEIGNLLAWCPAAHANLDTKPVVVAAHVDTVFGPDTPIEIRRSGSRWVGPGITDNARGLAVSLAVLRALVQENIEPEHPILFAFTVGEEARGDLRGTKHLFSKSSTLRDAEAFIAVDGSGMRRIIHHALGVRRFHISVNGAGGHSWTNWGRSNPANAIGDLIYRLAGLDLPERPRTTLTVARLGGGTSINAIPSESWVELDVRSEAHETLLELESRIAELLRLSIAAEEARGEGPLSSRLEIIGDRPAGVLPPSHPLVKAADAATQAFGEEPQHAVSSTDANVPLSLGIPAIAIGGGGESGDTHTENEWFDDTNGPTGALRLLSILQAIARF
jgi:tripeptide aminopeptidase